MFTFLTVVQAIIAAALVTVVLMQRSEGGGLGMGGGGSPAGLMSARGAADFMTRATTILATLFVVLSIVLAAMAVGTTSGRSIDTSLERAVTSEKGNSASDLIGDTGNAPAGAEPAPAASGAASGAKPDPLQGAAE